jgi:hypothetical protein
LDQTAERRTLLLSYLVSTFGYNFKRNRELTLAGDPPLSLTARAAVGFLATLLLANTSCGPGQPLACCSCVCASPDGSHCPGARIDAYRSATCELDCEASCDERECALESATLLSAGACPGGLIPFL